MYMHHLLSEKGSLISKYVNNNIKLKLNYDCKKLNLLFVRNKGRQTINVFNQKYKY